MIEQQSAQAAVFEIPELVQNILVFLDLRTLNTVRSLNKAFQLQCEPHFSILLIIGHRQRYQQLRELASLAKEHPNSVSPLDLIKSLHLSYQHNMYQEFQESVHQSLASLLNRCCNLREIIIEDRPGDKRTPTEKPQYQARVAWANFDVHQNNPCSTLDDDEKPWSYFDILPLEGSMFNRLETLKLVASECTLVKLDRFFNRLEQSPAAKTLRSLSVIASLNRVRSTSWVALRSCICNLKALQTLLMDGFQIDHCPTDDGIDSNKDEETIWLALRVRTLTVKCRPTLDIKLAIMDLFPNIESLYLGTTDELWEKALDERLFPKTVAHPSSSRMDAITSPRSIPFPRLKLLDVDIRSSTDWDESLLLHTWAQRQLHFQVQSLSLRTSERPSNHPDMRDLISTLAKYTLSVKHLLVTGRDRPQLCHILKSTIFRKLETLELQDFGQDFIEAVKEILRPGLSVREWQISRDQEQSLRDLLPWSRTLTRLLLTSSIGISFYSVLRDGSWNTTSICSLQSLLQMLPQLEDFELLEPIEDLALFDELGRQRVLEFKGTDMNLDLDLDLDFGSGMGMGFDMGLSFDMDLDMDLSGNTDSTTVLRGFTVSQVLHPLESYYMTERPLLKRLSLVQSQFFQDPRYYDPLTPWHIELKYKFRFLIDLTLKRR